MNTKEKTYDQSEDTNIIAKKKIDYINSYLKDHNISLLELYKQYKTYVSKNEYYDVRDDYYYYITRFLYNTKIFNLSDDEIKVVAKDWGINDYLTTYFIDFWYDEISMVLFWLFKDLDIEEYPTYLNIDSLDSSGLPEIYNVILTKPSNIKIFESYEEFLKRKDKTINGVDIETAYQCRILTDCHTQRVGSWNLTKPLKFTPLELEKLRKIEIDGILKDKRIMNKLEKSYVAVLCSETGKIVDWYYGPVKAWYVNECIPFTVEDMEFRGTYFDGCFMSYITKTK